MCATGSECSCARENKERYLCIVGLLRHYPEYVFEVVPLVLGATGLITNSVTENMKKIIQNDKEVEQAITRMQRKALVASMRILKSALSMRKI